MELAMFFILAVILLGIFISKNTRTKNNSRKPTFFYSKKNYILTSSEALFFRQIEKAVGEEYYVFPQVHLSSILNEKIKGQNWLKAFHFINGKSVDFILVEKSSLKTVVAIEIDDKSHERNDRQERDDKVESLFENAGISLLRINVNSRLSSEQIKTAVNTATNNSSTIRL